MSLKDIKNLKAIIVAVGGLVSVLPGVIPLVYDLGIPPDRESLFRNFVIAIIFIEAVTIIVAKIQLQKIPLGRLLKIGGVALATSFIALLAHSALFDWTVIRDRYQPCAECEAVDGEIYLPLWTHGELERVLSEDVEGRANFFTEYVPADIAPFAQEHGVAYLLTDAVLLTTFLLTVVPLSIVMMSGVVLLAAQKTSNN